MSLLVQITILLATALILVPLSKRLGLNHVLAFILTGLVLGPHLLNLNQESTFTTQLAHLGSLSLLFLLGLQLRPQRLWQLRGQINALGSLSLLLCTLVLMVALLLLFKLSLFTSLFLAVALSIASGTLLVESLQQQQLTNSRFGQQSFLLFIQQGVLALLLLALSPLFLKNTQNIQYDIAYCAALVAAFSGLFLMGRYVIRPLQRFLSKNATTELLTASAILQGVIVFLILTSLSIPATVSALLTGVLLADAEYRYEFETTIAPFKGTVLGMFFIAIGMSLNLNILISHSLWIFSALIIFIALKALCLFAVAYFYQRKWQQPLLLALSFAQAGEIAFISIQLLLDTNHLSSIQYQLLLIVVTLSMMLNPALFWFMRRYILNPKPQAAKNIKDTVNPQLIIAGFGRSGQIIARIAHIKQIPFTAIDNSPVSLQALDDSTASIIEGDATDIEVLTNAGIESAKVFALAIDDVESSMQIARYLRLNYPALCLIVRARDRHHLHLLKELGINHIWRETYLSSLGMAYQTLCQLNIPIAQAQQLIAQFRNHDEALIAEQQRIYNDDTKVYESYSSFIEELNYIFEGDQALNTTVSNSPITNDADVTTDSSPESTNSVPHHAQYRIDVSKNEFD
ncbi:cation:proton antiporter domain-containing protein [Acinetobacter rudis]|uniref:Cation:proton antiporter n=1 Tax=Acinetobacter rudis TaxID=632955 RepID=A0AAW8J989_9GAMM|nr:cation:proton antiporter [Acinetobacter rudis]MDQ8935271.1 cation:proton antiporter [Acinetobacter rudis]MDQ9017534.1 cation:proton antiporter [Acinetobacter rudis]